MHWANPGVCRRTGAMNEQGRPAHSVEALATELDDLVQLIENHPDESVQRLGLRLLDRVDALHRLGLSALIYALREANAAGPMQRALDEPPVRMLLQLYDLLPGDDPGPIEIALEQVRPTLGANGAEVALLSVTDGVPKLRLRVADPKDLQGLRELVVSVLREQFPALQTVAFDEPHRAMADELLPLMVVDRAQSQRWQWFPLRHFDTISSDSILTDSAAGRQLALWRCGDTVVGVRDVCPGSPLPLSAARLADGEVACPWHGCRFDARSGQRLNGPGEGLDLLTIAVRDGLVEVELPGEALALGVVGR